MKKLLLLCFIMTLLFTAFAHEYILLAAQYRLQKGDDLEVHLFVADGFNIQMERPFQQTPTRRFRLVTPDSTIDLSTQAAGTLPIVNRKVAFNGGGLLHLERDYARISLETDKFLDYLKEDHIEGIAPLIDKRKPEQKERYTRYIKALVQSGNTYSDTLYKQVLGQAFEIVLLQNPYTLRPGATLQAKVLFESKPLAGKVITARNRTGNQATLSQTSRTDKNGICTFKLVRKGDWFLHATYMIPSPDKADSDWESFWTTYSFGVD